MIFVNTLVGSHNSLVFCYQIFCINYYVRTIVSLPSISLHVTSSQCFSVRKYMQDRRFIISLAFSTFLCMLARHCSALPKVFSVLEHSYDKSTLLSVSLYFSIIIHTVLVLSSQRLSVC